MTGGHIANEDIKNFNLFIKFMLSVVENKDDADKNITEVTNIDKWDVNTITPKSKSPEV